MGKPEPLLPFQVIEGKDYWSAFGDTRWSAVRITTLKRKWATAERVNASSNEATKRGARVKVAELVPRDPKLKGKDKPQSPPSDVFARGRGQKKAIKPQIDDDAPKPVSKERPSSNGTGRQAQLEKLLARLDDDSTIDDW